MIGDLRKHPEFRKELEEIRKQCRPEPKLYHPKTQTAVDEWKYESGFIAGFDLLYSILTGETNG